MSDSRSRPRQIAGWTAVLLSTALSSFWAFWGAIENFHEGWYFREWWRNLALAAVQYLPWMFVPMAAALLALWRPWLGVASHLALAVGAVTLFGWRWSVGTILIATPLVGLAALYGYGRPTPAPWARRVLVGVPLVTAIASGVYPGWRAITRPATVDVSMRAIAGDGVDLVWAPAGPGWIDRGLSWFDARDRCARLSRDGTTLHDTPQHIWRLPTVDEAVRTMQFRGRNAGGAWDPIARRATYVVMPDKEAPLWNPYSPVIYWWTADEVDADRAYRVVFNGYVNALPKRIAPAYLSCRCVTPRS